MPYSTTKAQESIDSTIRLRQAIITAKKIGNITPRQQLAGTQLKRLSSFSVADALRYFAGVQIKDYGGIGGLKTVNIRSLGTNQLTVFYDGLPIGNAQNGQTDLGKFSLDNIEEVTVYNGQKSETLQPARDFGAAGTVYLRSRSPRFERGKPYNLKLTYRGGSFDLADGSLRWEQRLTERLSTSLSAEQIYSSGKYPFRYKRVHPLSHETVYDTTGIRANGDIRSQRLEAGVYGRGEGEEWAAKIYYYHSGRGIPGAIVNNVWRRAQRQWDRNFFAQATWQRTLSRRFDLLLKAKYANDYLHYLNPDTTLMHIDNTFRQEELYFSSAGRYTLTENWDAGLAVDLQRNVLHSNLAGLGIPQRWTTLIAASSSFRWGRLKMMGSLLATLIGEHRKTDDGSGAAIPNKHELTPALCVSYAMPRLRGLTLRAFYKHIFRMPTFNDLYYTDIGNIRLKPEYTRQFDAGFTYAINSDAGLLRSLDIGCDAYYNKITDKIVAVPKGDGMYRWMMMNLGRVEIRGIDASAGTLFSLSKELFLNLKATYTYQRAQDFTRRESEQLQRLTWGGQIPYIPRHSGSLIAGLTLRSWNLNYSFIYVGERYHNSSNIAVNYEQPWYTHDVNLSKRFGMKWGEATVALEVNNIFSQDYEVVMNYPMPKRNYKITLTLTI